MIDLHTHILPNIDDGPSSYEESMEMLKTMIDNGVDTVVATPHFDFCKDDKDDFVEKRNSAITKLKSLISEYNGDIKILSGAELMFSSNLNNYDLSDFTIENTDYLLIELATKRNEPNLEKTLSAIIAKGYIPILAHVERYNFLLENSHRLVTLVEIGVLMQINADTLCSKKKYPFIDTLIRKNLVHIISSDAHNMQKRLPNLKSKDVGDEFIANHRKIIANLTVNVSKPKKMFKVLGKFI